MAFPSRRSAFHPYKAPVHKPCDPLSLLLLAAKDYRTVAIPLTLPMQRGAARVVDMLLWDRDGNSLMFPALQLLANRAISNKVHSGLREKPCRQISHTVVVGEQVVELQWGGPLLRIRRDRDLYAPRVKNAIGLVAVGHSTQHVDMLMLTIDANVGFDTVSVNGEVATAALRIGAPPTDYVFPSARGSNRQLLSVGPTGVAYWADIPNPFDQPLNVSNSPSFCIDRNWGRVVHGHFGVLSRRGQFHFWYLGGRKCRYPGANRQYWSPGFGHKIALQYTGVGTSPGFSTFS